MAQTFKTAQEAAEKGRQDLLEVLKSGRDINLGVTADQLGSAKAGEPVRRMVLDFDQILKMEEVKSMASIAKPEGKAIVPYMVGEKVVTVIEVAKSDEGWKVAGLAGSVLSNDLTSVMRVAGRKGVMVYEVPNLRQLVYVVQTGNEEQYFTTYQGRSLRQAAQRGDLFAALQADAQAFQTEFGEEVQEQRLVR